jgi:hypothetical protein
MRARNWFQRSDLYITQDSFRPKTNVHTVPQTGKKEGKRWGKPGQESTESPGKLYPFINSNVRERGMYLLDHAALFSTVFGIVCGMFIARKRFGFILVLCVPVFTILSILIYNEYFVPYAGGGASMWPIAMIFCAVPAVICACFGCALAQLLVKLRKS